MTVRCQYCGHSAAAGVAACANCGAPLPAGGPSGPTGATAPAGHQQAQHQHGAAAAHLAEMSGWAASMGVPGAHGHHAHGGPATAVPEHPEHHAPGETGHHHGHHRGLLGFLRSHLVDEAETVVRKHHPKWQWRAAGGIAVAVLLVLAFLMVKSCTLTGPPLTGPSGFGGGPVVATDAVSALPDPLRGAACRPHEETDGVQSCVLDAGSPLLMGEITGGRPLAFQVQTATPGALTQAIAQWRSAAGSVVSDGAVFAAISSSGAVWYADTQSGLRVDTGAFTGSAGARTFLIRSGLLHP